MSVSSVDTEWMIAIASQSLNTKTVESDQIPILSIFQQIGVTSILITGTSQWCQRAVSGN